MVFLERWNREWPPRKILPLLSFCAAINFLEPSQRISLISLQARRLDPLYWMWLTTLLRPSPLFAALPPSLKTLEIDLGSNPITASPLDASLFAGVSSAMISVRAIFDNIQFGGPLPAQLFPFTNVRIVASFRNCGLSGTLPTPLFSGAVGYASSIDLENNLLTGSVDLGTLIARSSTTASFITFSLAHNKLSGSINLPSFSSSNAQPGISLDVSSNLLNTISFASDVNDYLTILDISNNQHLHGSIPNELFDGEGLRYFMAANTSLSGTMPHLTNLSTLILLDLSNAPGINFCDAGRPSLADHAFTSCSLGGTNAENCPQLYPSFCIDASNPTFVPLNPPMPIPTTLPSTPTTAGPVSPCNPKTRPSLDFICIGTTWTAPAGVTTPILVIPSGAQTVVVQGNMSTSTILFSGTGSTLILNGCATNLTEVSIQLSKDDIEKLPSKKTQQLLSYDSNSNTSACGNFSDVQLSVRATESSCRRVQASKSSTNSGFSVLFSVDSSSCKTWWIILVSVVCGLIVVAIIIIIALVAFVPSFRAKVRPYSRRRNPAENIST